MKLVGKLEHRDIGPGVWTLVSEAQSWTLIGPIPPQLAGQTVEVDGSPANMSAGFGMTGQLFEIRTINPRS